jgi:hypothetical protein
MSAKEETETLPTREREVGPVMETILAEAHNPTLASP